MHNMRIVEFNKKFFIKRTVKCGNWFYWRWQDEYYYMSIHQWSEMRPVCPIPSFMEALTILENIEKPFDREVVVWPLHNR